MGLVYFGFHRAAPNVPSSIVSCCSCCQVLLPQQLFCWLTVVFGFCWLAVVLGFLGRLCAQLGRFEPFGTSVCSAPSSIVSHRPSGPTFLSGVVSVISVIWGRSVLVVSSTSLNCWSGIVVCATFQTLALHGVLAIALLSVLALAPSFCSVRA